MTETIVTRPVLGIPIACVTYDSTLAELERLARKEQVSAICPANTHIVSEGRRDPEFAAVLSRFDLLLPDGMPVLWELNRSGAGLADRVTGPELLRRAVVRFPKPWRHFFFGDTPACLEKAIAAAKRLQPDILVAGTYCPPFHAFGKDDDDASARAIQAVDPDFIWVALPGVRKERWIVANLGRYRRGVFIAVGDGLKLLAGERRVAPQWMQRAGLGWLHRMMGEPRRLLPRYVKYNSLWLYYLARERLRQG